jgi:sodium/potassium-transporting ATPase subunit alpha
MKQKPSVFGVLLEIALILLIDYNYWGNIILEMAPIDGKVWFFVLPFASGLLILEEFRKWFVRVRLLNRVARQKPSASG